MSTRLIAWIVLYAVVVLTPFLPFMQNNVYAGPIYMVVLSVAAWALLYSQSVKDVEEYLDRPGPAPARRPGDTQSAPSG